MLATVALAMVAVGTPSASQAWSAHSLRVMTRNLYLGADLTPALQATSLPALNDAAEAIFNQVKANDFPVRAKGLAQEILRTRPDLVGLQETALWRTEPTCKYTVPPAPYTATHVAYDYVRLLLKQLNKGKRRYAVVATEPEFDFETEANTDGSPDHSCDEDVRLTMCDAILARVDDRVRWRNVQSGHCRTLLAPKLVGARHGAGDERLDQRRRQGARQPLVPVRRYACGVLRRPSQQPHEPGTAPGNGQVREAQAKELIQNGGPANGKLPVTLVSDLNSDVKTPLKPGDQLADKGLLKAGFRERSTYKPLSCRLKTPLLTAPGRGGKIRDFNHKVDHVMTNQPKKMTLVGSAITGRHPVNGFWDSDHAGTFSALALR